VKSPPAYIWVRDTVDWSDWDAVEAQLPTGFDAKVERWNRTFEMPFHLFRHRVREIAELNHSSVEGAVCAEWDEIPDGALVLPTDDDDWFAPGIVAELRAALDPAALGCWWQSSWLEVPTDIGHMLHLVKQKLPWSRQFWTCTTNNYAMLKLEGTRWPLYRHVYASRWMDGGGARRMRRVDRTLSVQNRTLASRTSLGLWQENFAHRSLRAKHRAYRRLYRRADLAGVEWARPYVEMMGALMSELEPRG